MSAVLIRRLPLRRPARTNALLATLLLSGTLAVAQLAQLSGTARDPDQSVIVNARVTLEDQLSHATLTTTTDPSGAYTFAAVAPGIYTLRATRPGFADVVIASVTVGSDGTLTRDLAFSLAESDTSITVRENTSGTPEAGYYVPRVDRGVLGNSPIVNQPYTITVLPSEQIANTQVKSLRDAINFLPLVSYTEQQGNEILRPSTRGIQGSIAQNTRMDGMAMAITGANPIEQYQELQVENGLGAAMYGPANPSGMFDFVLKRPTEERTTNLYLEQDSQSIGTAYLDAGGRLGHNKFFGYRSNLLFGDGTAFVEQSRLRRRLGEFAFDVRPSNRTTLDAHYSAYDVVQRGFPGWFTYGPDPTDTTATAQRPKRTLFLPAAPDPTRLGFGQAYAGINLTTQSTSVRLLHDFSPNWHAMAGGVAQRLDRFIDTPVNNLSNNTGSYNTTLAAGFAPRFGVESDLGYITGTINKWGVRQDVVAASEGYRFNQYSSTSPSANSLKLGSASIANPISFPAPSVGLPQNRGLYQSAVVHQQGFNLGDLLYFPRRFAIRLAASQDWIGVDNNSSTARTSGSNKQGISPSASVMYKPTLATTVYGTFASSLQQGDIAPGGTVTNGVNSLVNPNQALPPYRSQEWEIGFKSAGRPINLTTALFRIQRPFANTVPFSATQNIFKISGEQVNFGAEISAQGTLFHRLLLDAGFTALNARLNDTGINATQGKRFVGIPPYHSNLYSEFRVPHVANLAITGNWEFSGNRPQDDENLHTTPGFNTFNLGARYAHPLFTKLATLRFTANNLSNTHFFSTIAAGDITGTNASSNTAHLGSPRTLSSSLQFAF